MRTPARALRFVVFGNWLNIAPWSHWPTWEVWDRPLSRCYWALSGRILRGLSAEHDADVCLLGRQVLGKHGCG
jgi:hypothetical protein